MGLPHYKIFEVDSRLRYFKPNSTRVAMTFAEEVSDSLGRQRGSRFISPKFFYDDAGSDLFEQICTVPEYYLTRTEIDLLHEAGGELEDVLAKALRCAGVADHHGKSVRLVELGSGSSLKTRIILDALVRMQDGTEYIPIDISDILAQSSEQLLSDYSSLRITGIIDTYEGGLEFLREYDDNAGRSLIIFLGSSYGNLSPADGMTFLRNVRSAMRPGDCFLIGLDMVKDAAILESAYDDSEGITSKFNLNVLLRINSDLGADFDTDNFAHRAHYNSKMHRVEMYLESLRDQTVSIPASDIKIELGRGELIHTENSHKYTPGQIDMMLAESGFVRVKSWSDHSDYFTLILATAA